MKFNPFLSLIILLFISQLTLSQTTYFIKYKNYVDKTSVEEKVSLQKFTELDAPYNLPDYNIDFLAKGVARDEETIGRIIKIQFQDNVSNDVFTSLVSSDFDIEYFQPARTYQLDFIPNDSLVTEQWALNNIRAFDAWDITQGADSVLLAIIDTGMDYDHLDLKNKIYINNGETGTDNLGRDKRYNGIDDDNNGFIDDYRGWDFTDRVGFPFDSTGGDYLTWDNNPYDDNGHGTYISGLAGAETNNLTGMAGAAPNVKMLNIRAFDPGGYGEEDDVAAAILYAVQMNARVINMSFGDYSFSYVLRDVIRYAYSQNVVLIASAGNQGSDEPHYPSGYSEVICVGNSTQDDFVSGNSNYGSTLDLVAPGSSVLTTSRNNGYALISGTSASAPYVSAAASLILSRGYFTNEEVKQILKSTTDDIGESGWDLRSGAGRLNLQRAVSIIAPSEIKFIFPRQDFSTLENNLPITATVLSPYFSSYNLQVGKGFNPEVWDDLLINGQSQFSNTTIYDLNIANYNDTVYTLRLEVTLINGRTLEERVNFYVNRTPPSLDFITGGPAFYGDKLTIMAALFTDEPSVVRMYYRKTGEIQYNFITLDGFATNNQFVKNLHYGFIPKALVEQNSFYEIYFEAENLVGLKTENYFNGSPYVFSTELNTEISAENKLPFTLPAGSLYEDPVNLISSQSDEIILRELDNPKTSKIYSYNNGTFELKDTLYENIVKDYGDFNGNGLKDLLTFFVRDGFIYEQTNSNGYGFSQKFSKLGGNFWPILADDVDNDGKTEIFAVESDSTISVWEANSSLNLTQVATLNNFTPVNLLANIFTTPDAVIADINGDGIKEIWFIDLDGDVFSYNIVGNGFQPGFYYPTYFIGSSSFLAVGDYNGDSIDEIAILVHSVDQIDIAPFYRLQIFNFVGNQLNVIYDKPFIDAATEFNNSFRQVENRLRFIDLDNDNFDELILFMFPYSYIFKYNSGDNTLITYKENINSNSVFVGDLNRNGVPEVAFPNINEIEFFEFAISNKASTPYQVTGFSISKEFVQLDWLGNGDLFYIYKGNSPESLLLIDSVQANSYIDGNVAEGETYFYSVSAYDFTKPDPFSSLSSPIEVYVHSPAFIVNVKSQSSNSVLVNFSERIKNTIENLQSFEIVNIGYPNSISPANQYSYLLSFSSALPDGENTLIVKNLRDFYNSPIATDTLTFLVEPTPDVYDFFITSFEIVNPYKIKIDFNYGIDASSAANVNNYKFEPDNKVSTVAIDQSTNSIYLDLTNQKPVGSIGKEYVLRLENIYSDAASGNRLIKSGAGSYIVLTSFAKNLSDVYVYPNPVRAASNSLFFANLTQNAKITIWNIDGTRINELVENNGDGGVEYNLKDSNGNDIGSGVYFYRVVSVDDSGNEGEEILGKFAVLR